MPARAPASIDMLQTVMRSSIDMRADRRARVLDGMAGRRRRRRSAAMTARMTSFAWTTERARAVDDDTHDLAATLPEALGGQHVLDLGGADAERERAEGAVGRGVGIAAHEDEPGCVKPCSGPMTWTMPWRESPGPRSSMPCRACGARVVSTIVAHSGSAMPAARPRSARSGRPWRTAASGRRTVRPAPGEPLEGGDAAVVQQEPVDVEQRAAAGPVRDDMAAPRSCRTSCGASGMAVSSRDGLMPDRVRVLRRCSSAEGTPLPSARIWSKPAKAWRSPSGWPLSASVNPPPPQGPVRAAPSRGRRGPSSVARSSGAGQDASPRYRASCISARVNRGETPVRL